MIKNYIYPEQPPSLAVNGKTQTPQFEALRVVTPGTAFDRAAETAWIACTQRDGAGCWLDNAHGAVDIFESEGYWLPATCCIDGPETAYVASLPSAWVRYGALEATRILPAARVPLVRGAVGPLVASLRLAGLDRAALLNNWLISTNLHPPLSAAGWLQLRNAALARYPDRVLAIRNICDAVNPGIETMLTHQGWWLAPVRRIWLCDPAQAGLWQRNHVRRDHKLLADGKVEYVDHAALSETDLPALQRVFRQVFIDRYGRINPDFSLAFFAHCLNTRHLRFVGLRYGGELVGVIGLLERHGWLTTPLIGHDTSRPVALGLYRRLMALLLDEAWRRKCRLHYSSGVGGFKAMRGGKPAIEYVALYLRHRPGGQRLVAHLLTKLAGGVLPPLFARYG